jgi:kynurenine formamidase
VKNSSTRFVFAVGILVSLVCPNSTAWGREPIPELSLLDLQKILISKKFIDLTHEFAPGIPHWPGFPDEQQKTIYRYEKQPGLMGDGFFAEVFTHVGQWGTHVDPPAHFHKGLRTVDQIELKEMILPLICVDVHEECAKNRDYTLTVDRLKKWEAEHGTVPAGAFVVMRTDWSKPLAGRCQNGEQRQRGRCSLPGVEFAGT